MEVPDTAESTVPGVQNSSMLLFFFGFVFRLAKNSVALCGV